MKETVEIDGISYTVGTITAGANKAFPVNQADGKEFSFLLVVASLQAGGDENAQATATNMPDGLFDANSPYKQIVKLAMKVNGYKDAPVGEAAAGESPVQPTGSSSTVVSPAPSDGVGAT